MKNTNVPGNSALLIAAVGLVALTSALAGCGSPPPSFEPNLVYLKAEERNGTLTEAQLQQLADALGGFFGTPDEPRVPNVEGVDMQALLDSEKLAMAAGPVGSDELGKGHGLYRKHCVHCHGITGDGAGPTAKYLNPYPRDYRRATFKFKSTPAENPPTHEDLKRILVQGINGTSMPSFKLLDDNELDALVHYVRYLSIRGRVERNIIRSATQELSPEDALLDLDLARGTPEQQEQFQEQLEILREELAREVRRWAEAESTVKPVPDAPSGWQPEFDAEGSDSTWLVTMTDGTVLAGEKVSQTDSELLLNVDGQQRRIALSEVDGHEPANQWMAKYVDRGKQLFFGNVANCAQCHGQLALGDGQVTDYDEWTSEWTVKMNPPINPKTDFVRVNEFLRLGALPPRNIHPRNLRQGIYRGGRRPVDIYLRVKNGIAGTPMPAASSKLTDEDLWSIVAYVRSLPYEPISQPPRNPGFQRDRG